jgi:hypothetical protein
MAITLISFGCPRITPHENFKAHLYGQIGMSLDEIPSYQWPFEKDKVDFKVLPNGNIENKYKHYRGNCFYIFEIDPKTRKIVGARYEGSERDCVVNP